MTKPSARALRAGPSRPLALRLVAGQLVVLVPLAPAGRPELYLALWLAPWLTVPFDTGWHLAHHVDMGVPWRACPASTASWSTPAGSPMRSCTPATGRCGLVPTPIALPPGTPAGYGRQVTDDFVLLAGSANPRLAAAIAAYLDHPLCLGETLRFSEGNLFVRVPENVRGRDVFLVQGTAFPANDNFVELLFWIDALNRASAASVTAVVPYFSYAKGDKKDEPRVSIRARVCADAIEAAGVDRIITMDLHAPQVQGFFRVPVDDLYALPVLCEAVQAKHLPDLVVVSPDAGFAKKAKLYARRLRAPLAIADKERADHAEAAHVVDLIGEVEGRTALVVDDFTISAGTLVDAARVLVERGARTVYAAVSHGLLAGAAVERIDASPIERLFITDSVETQPVELSDRIEVVSVAGLFGEAIRRISRRESISVLFS